MTEDILKVVCPHCKDTLRIKKPTQGGRHTYRCPKCQKAFAIDVKSDDSAKVEENTSSPKTQEVRHTKSDLLHLFIRRRLRSDKQLKLKVGSNIIGTESEEKPSDIMVNDSYISRRSADIAVELDKDNACKYLFTLNRTTNPAYYNGKQIPQGTSFYMKDGDEFQLGKTKFYVKRCDTF